MYAEENIKSVVNMNDSQEISYQLHANHIEEFMNTKQWWQRFRFIYRKYN